MAQGLRLHAALTAGQSSGRSTHIRWLIPVCNSSSRGSQTFALWHLFSCARTWIHTPKTIKIIFKKSLLFMNVKLYKPDS